MKKIFALSLATLTLCACGCSGGSGTGSNAGSEEANPTEAPKVVELYQLAPEHDSLMQSYVIKTENNKLIVIDGGIDGVGYDKDPYLPSALRAIAGVGEGEYFEVEAWFLSHAHKDHFNELSKMLAVYSSETNYKINNIYFDFPPYATDEFKSDTNDRTQLETLKEGMANYARVNNITVQEGSTYYDDINSAVINAEAIEQGLEMNIDGIRLEIMQTWAKSDGANINNSSLVLRAWVDGQSILFLNDLGTAGGVRLRRAYEAEELKSDIVQMAHHGQAGVAEKDYQMIDAKVHLWPTPLWVWKNESGIYQIDEVRTWLYGETFLEDDEYNIVACLYDAYPEDPTSVSDWKKVKDGMKITLPYAYAMDNAEATPEITPETTPEG